MKMDSLAKEVIAECLYHNKIPNEIVDTILKELDEGMHELYAMENDVPSTNLVAYNTRQEKEKYTRLQKEKEMMEKKMEEEYKELQRINRYRIARLEEKIEELQKATP